MMNTITIAVMYMCVTTTATTTMGMSKEFYLSLLENMQHVCVTTNTITATMTLLNSKE